MDRKTVDLFSNFQASIVSDSVARSNLLKISNRTSIPQWSVKTGHSANGSAGTWDTVANKISQAVARIVYRTASQQLGATWHHRSRDHLIAHVPFPIGGPIGTRVSNPAVFEILHSKKRILGSRVWPFKVTWRHQSRDHLIAHMPLPVGDPLEPSLYL